MRRIVLSAALAALMGFPAFSQPAQAQSDTRALYDRIDRLERDLQMLQSQAARSGGSVSRSGSGPTVITSPAAGGISSSSSSNDPAPPLPAGPAARYEDRLVQFEEQLRELTGKVEEATFKTQQLTKQMERMQADIDLRFKDLQQSSQAGASEQQSVTMPAASGGAPAAAAVKAANSAEGTGPAPGPQTLGSIPKKELDKALAAQAAAQPAAKPADPKTMYDEAYAALQRGDYSTAQRGFEDFLKKNPSHDLAGNAAYWRAETAYVQKDFKSAAAQFAESYKKYPKSGKAPDMLYKLGASFGQLGMKKEACKALSLLFTEHPNMSDRVKRSATAEKQKQGCS